MHMEQTPDTVEQGHKWDSGNQKQITGVERNTTWDCKWQLDWPSNAFLWGMQVRNGQTYGETGAPCAKKILAVI